MKPIWTGVIFILKVKCVVTTLVDITEMFLSKLPRLKLAIKLW